MTRPAVVLVAPIMPSDRHNGLAMRAGMFLDALAPVADVRVVVLPVAGSVGTDEWTRARADIATASELDNADVVLAIRGYTAPFALELAARLGASRTVVDLDDDDERLMVELGHPDAAARAAGIARTVLRDVDVVSLASPVDAEHVASRHKLTNVITVPNAVTPLTTTAAPPGTARVLYVGNLTYAPNIDAVRTLVTQVLPALQELRPDTTIDLVGNHDGGLDDLASVDGVALAGLVPDVTPLYAQSDVVVVPLRSASGTRIKVLESFSHRRPVVASPAAVSGLAVRDGVDVLVAKSPTEFAKKTAAVLDDPALSAQLTATAFATLVARYSPAVVAPAIRGAVLGTDQ